MLKMVKTHFRNVQFYLEKKKGLLLEIIENLEGLKKAMVLPGKIVQHGRR